MSGWPHLVVGSPSRVELTFPVCKFGMAIQVRDLVTGDSCELSVEDLVRLVESRQPDVPVTTVVFRKWLGGKDGHGVIALFPDEIGGPSDMCQSFEHVGQHGAAHYEAVVQRTRPAKPAEYADLMRELESYPYKYRLRVVLRRPRYSSQPSTV